MERYFFVIFLAIVTSSVIADDVLVIDVDFDQDYGAADVNATITDEDKKIFPFNRYFEFIRIIGKDSSDKILITPDHGDNTLAVIFDQCPECEQNLKLVDIKNMTESFHFESHGQYFYYLTKKIVANNETNGKTDC